MLRQLVITLIALFGALVYAPGWALAQTPAEPAQAGAAPGAPLVSDPDYRLGQGDVVDVVVLGSNDFNTRTRVSTDGAILLPLVGAVQAINETPSTLALKVTDALKKGGFFANPVVRVELVGIRSRYVTVLGFVSNLGLIPLDRNYRLSEILARVGGKAQGGAGYVVLTPVQGEGRRFQISGLAMASGAEDPVVNAGDKIFIPSAEDEVFYISGEVRNPGAQPTTPNTTVRIAVARSGGVTENGNEKKVTVVRAGKKLSGANLDTVIEPGDVITIGARLF